MSIRLAVCLLLTIGCVSSSIADRPNVLLIMADDVGTDAVGCYGGQSYPTPHIDALAAGGMKFNHGYAMPVCHPSRICLMTGRYPFRFGAAGQKWGGYPKTAEGNSIGDVMKNGGYAAAVAGKWQLCMLKNDHMHPERTGFDEWLLFGWHEGGRFHDPLLYETGEHGKNVKGHYGPDLYVDFLTKFMAKSAEKGQPFFAYYPMALCHPVTNDLQDRHVAYYRDGRWMTYGEMVASMDDMVGRLVSFLEKSGLRESTLIIFTTDNGTTGTCYLHVDEQGTMVKNKVVSVRNDQVIPGGKGKTDDTGTRVPLIANWPAKIAAGVEVEDMADLTDILPTIREVAGMDSDGIERDGISYAPVLLGTPELRERREWVYVEHRKKRCVRSSRWKLYAGGRFYDLEKDPLERSPLNPERLSGDAETHYQKLRTEIDKLAIAAKERGQPKNEPSRKNP